MPEYLSIPYRPGALFVWRAAQASKEEEIKAAVQSEREAILALFDQYDYEDIADVIRARSEK
jgi:hypothetical protein